MRTLLVASLGAAILSTSCATLAKLSPARIVKSEGQVHVLEYPAGEWGGDWYDENFKAAASAACGGKMYTVTEKAKVPTPFKCAESVLDPENFYWVVKCEE